MEAYYMKPINYSFRLLAFMAVSLLTLIGCGLTAVKSDIGKPLALEPKTLILFGGIGYINDSAQQYLYRLLTDQQFRLEDATDASVAELNLTQNGLPRLSPYPIALDLEDAEMSLADYLNAEQVPLDGVAHLERHFDQVLGLFFIGSYEQHMGFSYRYPLANGDEQTAYHDYFFTSVSAVLFNLETDEILLSASALGHENSQAAAAPVTDKEAFFIRAYNSAAKAALTRLTKLVATRNLRQLRSEDRHMVTGVWVNGQQAQDQFSWRHPGASPDLCQVPSGCTPDSVDCAQFSALLAHGITDALSERGLITLPPLNWSQWRSDNAWEVSARFSLPENRRSLTDRLIEFSLDPSQTTHKYVAALDDIAFSRQADRKNPFLVTDQYLANLSLIRAHTTPGNCLADKGMEVVDHKDFYGVYASHHTRSQPEASKDQKNLFYQIALINALQNLPKEIR